MSQFGKQSGGGRRRGARSLSGTPAVFTTVSRSQSTIVQEISCTGARIEGPRLPRIGEEFFLVLGDMHVFATARWIEGSLCGVHFETPLHEDDIHHLRRKGPSDFASRRYLEQKQAYEDWTAGVAR
jgi:hypothetical protein